MRYVSKISELGNCSYSYISQNTADNICKDLDTQGCTDCVNCENCVDCVDCKEESK